MNKNRNLSVLAALMLLLTLTLFILPVYAFSGGGNTIYLPLVQNQSAPNIPQEVPTPTVDPSSVPFTFISWADTKSGTAVLAALSSQVKKLNPVFTLFPGDLENAGFTTTGMNAWKIALNANTGNGMDGITFPLRGNHNISSTSSWQAYFDVTTNAARIGATNFSTYTKNLTYTFDYQNAIFIGIDVPGDANLITSGQIDYLDSALTTAESRGLTHAFIYFHGPIYPVSSHTNCPTRTCATPSNVASLIKVINKHPIVSAVFNGHEHLQAYVHMDNTRVPEITHPFEQFITGAAGASLNTCDKTFRFDYCGSYPGFAAITVSGQSFTVMYYQQGSATPIKAYTFSKN